MNKKKIGKAVIMAIAEDILDKLVWDSDLDKYILPEGAIFSIEKDLAHLAADIVGVTMFYQPKN